MGIPFRHGDSIHPVPRCDVQDLAGLSLRSSRQSRYEFRSGNRQRRHRTRKVDPQLVVGLGVITNRARGPALPHGFRQSVEVFLVPRISKKIRHGCKACGRMAIQKNSRLLSERVALRFLGQESVDSQIIAKNPHAAFRSTGLRGKENGRIRPICDDRENIQFDSSFQRGALLVGAECIENVLRGGPAGCRRCGHGRSLLS